MDLLTIEDIDKAYENIKPFVTKTPLVTNEAINSLVKAKVSVSYTHLTLPTNREV